MAENVEKLENFMGDNTIIINIGKDNVKGALKGKIKQSFIIDSKQITLVDVHYKQTYVDILTELKEYISDNVKNIIFMGNPAEDAPKTETKSKGDFGSITEADKICNIDVNRPNNSYYKDATDSSKIYLSFGKSITGITQKNLLL